MTPPRNGAEIRSGTERRVLLLDNHDSFTFNLVQALRTLGAAVRVEPNDLFDVAELDAIAPTHVVISPGPGRPEQAGATLALIERAAGRYPLLGVCLGHQAIALAFGGRVVHAARLMHGKSSAVHHDRRGLFQGLPNPLDAARYHSLAVDADSLPATLKVTAFTSNGEVMGLRHRELPIESVQFHPESVLTPAGDALLRNFLRIPTPQPAPTVAAEALIR